MPVNGQPLQGLRSIIIRGSEHQHINCAIPAVLPSLEELVVKCEGRLELLFEDP